MQPGVRARAIAAAVLAACLLPSAFVAWRYRDMPFFGHPHDDALYFVVAKSIAAGDGLHIASLPGQPWQTKYPPLFPLALTLVWRIAPEFPGNLAWATALAWVWLPVWLALSWRALRDLDLDWRVALGLCGVVAFNQTAAHFAMRTQPELMFAALWTASAVLAMRGRSPGAAGILAGAAYLTKTAALPMLIAAPLYYAVRRQYRAAAVFAVSMLPPVVLWSLWARAHLAPSTDPLRAYYTDYLGYHLRMVALGDYPAILARNCDALFSALGELLLGWAVEPGVATRLTGVVMVLGTVRHARRTGMTPYHLFAAGYAALLLIWHYPPEPRFLLPVFPVALAGLWTLCSDLYSALARRRRAAAVAFAGACAAVLLCSGVAAWLRFPRYCNYFRELRAGYGSGYAWIARNTSADAAFLASEDALLYLYTGRRAITPIVPMRYFYRADGDAILQYTASRPQIARRLGLDYIFDAPRDWQRELTVAVAEEARRTLARNPDVRRVYDSSGCVVYRVR